MEIQASRSKSRVDLSGEPVAVAEQDDVGPFGGTGPGQEQHAERGYDYQTRVAVTSPHGSLRLQTALLTQEYEDQGQDSQD